MFTCVPRTPRRLTAGTHSAKSRHINARSTLRKDLSASRLLHTVAFKCSVWKASEHMCKNALDLNQMMWVQAPSLPEIHSIVLGQSLNHGVLFSSSMNVVDDV